MNQLYGAASTGKKRLATLVAAEKEALRNPTLGRSRAERVLDEGFHTLAGSASKRVRLTRIDEERIRKLAARKLKAKQQALENEQPPAGPGQDLIQLVRRLDFPPKFARTLELLKRYFATQAGKRQLNAWRAVIESASNFGDLSSLLNEAKSQQAWLVFWLVFRLGVHPSIAQNGDSRADVLWLFEHILKVEDELSVEVATYPCKLTNAAGSSLTSYFAVPTDLSAASVSAAVAPPVPSTESPANAPIAESESTAEVCVSEAVSTADDPEPAASLLVDVSVTGGEESANEGSNPSVSNPSPPTEEIEEYITNMSFSLNSPIGVKVTLHADEDEACSDKDLAADWREIYVALLPAMRVSCVSHNLLFTDDSHIYHRGLAYLDKLIDDLPAVESEEERTYLATPVDVGVCNVEPAQLLWAVPNGLELLKLKKSLFFDCLSDVFLTRKQKWARKSVETFFQKLYFIRHSHFSPLQIHQIESWQAQLKTEATAASTESRSVHQPPKMAEPGVANVPIKDVRSEVINVEAGSAAWASRQLT